MSGSGLPYKRHLMIIYSVTIHLLSRIEGEWIDWMKEKHIPDVMNTGCFTRCQMLRALDPATEEVTYQMRYLCRSLVEYERYRDTFAAALQKEHSDRFAGWFRGSRQLLEEVLEVASGEGA